jgi:hypothetical protein
MVTLIREARPAAETDPMNYEQNESLPSGYSAIPRRDAAPIQSDTSTRRCRLYRTTRDLLPGQDLYVEVWDSESEPEDVSRLPVGSELVASFQDTSIASAHAQVVDYRRQRGYLLRGNWNCRGSI